MEDAGAHVVEDGGYALQEGRVGGAAEHECQGSCCGADDAAGHGGVDEGAGGGGGDGVRDVEGGLGIDGGVVDEEAGRGGCGEGGGEDGVEDGGDVCGGWEGEVDGCLCGGQGGQRWRNGEAED